MSYRLVDHGYPFKKIMHGKQWVGRVGRHLSGGYLGTIGSLTVSGTTERDAFEQVVAKHLGYDSAGALHAKNKAVRQRKRLANKLADHLGAQMMAGNFETVDKLGPQGLVAGLQGATRLLRKGKW